MFEQPTDTKKYEKEKIHEQIFTTLINKQLIQDLEDDLYEIFDDEIVDKILNEINNFNNDEQKMILAIPKSIRERRLKNLSTKININKPLGVRDFVKELFDSAKSNGFTLGYHISPNKIVQKDSDWTVDATDLDDRDDRKMAYYSLDYANLFRKKRGNYLYVIRAEIGQKSTHKRDNTNNWGRADKLSIITELPLSEIDEKVEKLSTNPLKKAA